LEEDRLKEIADAMEESPAKDMEKLSLRQHGTWLFACLSMRTFVPTIRNHLIATCLGFILILCCEAAITQLHVDNSKR